MPLGADVTTPPAVGTTVRIRTRKWDGSPHWQTEMAFLGEDEHGLWLGSPAGNTVSRPGRQFVGLAACAKLIPHDGWFVAHFNGPESHLSVYTDIATPAVLGRDDDGWTLGAVDLDLDVVVTADGELRLDDEDEFAEHQVRYGYPPDVIATAEATAAELLAAIRAGAEPWVRVGHGWLARIP